jgi:hypothetical protein
MGRVSRASRAAVITAVALAGCGRDARRVRVGDGPYAREVNEAIPKIEKSVGLTFKTVPKVATKTKAELLAFLTAKFTEELAAKEIDGQERAYKRFGLIPDTLKLAPFMLSLLAEQVAAFYDPSTKTLYIVSGAPPETIGITVSHELVHALQDQYMSLDSIQKMTGDDDRQVAAQAVIEGEATFEQMQVVLGGSVAAFPGGWDRMREVIREQASSMPIFAAAPLAIQETLVFPYLSGAEFTRRFKEKRPGGVPFKALPASTEQVLHEAAYFGTVDEPTRVMLPAPNAGKVLYQNVMGEFQTRLFLFQHLQDQASAMRGAAGWDGDRYVLFDTGRGDAIAWLTIWDSKIDAGEFYDLMDTAVLKRFRGARPRGANTQTRTYEAGARTIALTAAEVGGRPAVLFVDVPAGTPTTVLDLSKVTLAER